MESIAQPRRLSPHEYSGAIINPTGSCGFHVGRLTVADFPHAAKWRHVGNLIRIRFPTCRKWEACGKCIRTGSFRNSGDPCGKHVGSISEASEEHLGDIWETFGET